MHSLKVADFEMEYGTGILLIFLEKVGKLQDTTLFSSLDCFLYGGSKSSRQSLIEFFVTHPEQLQHLERIRRAQSTTRRRLTMQRRVDALRPRRLTALGAKCLDAALHVGLQSAHFNQQSGRHLRLGSAFRPGSSVSASRGGPRLTEILIASCVTLLCGCENVRLLLCAWSPEGQSAKRRIRIIQTPRMACCASVAP